jgi:hypothetical protein
MIAMDSSHLFAKRRLSSRSAFLQSDSKKRKRDEMKKRWALITAAMGAFVCMHVIATSAQEISNRENTPAVLALESERAPIPLAATGSADQIAAVHDADVSTPGSGGVPYSDIHRHSLAQVGICLALRNLVPLNRYSFSTFERTS